MKWSEFKQIVEENIDGDPEIDYIDICESEFGHRDIEVMEVEDKLVIYS